MQIIQRAAAGEVVDAMSLDSVSATLQETELFVAKFEDFVSGKPLINLKRRTIVPAFAMSVSLKRECACDQATKTIQITSICNVFTDDVVARIAYRDMTLILASYNTCLENWDRFQGLERFIIPSASFKYSLLPQKSKGSIDVSGWKAEDTKQEAEAFIHSLQIVSY